MRLKGLEPSRRETPDPKSGASANSATSAVSSSVFHLAVQKYGDFLKPANFSSLKTEEAEQVSVDLVDAAHGGMVAPGYLFRLDVTAHFAIALYVAFTPEGAGVNRPLYAIVTLRLHQPFVGLGMKSLPIDLPNHLIYFECFFLSHHHRVFSLVHIAVDVPVAMDEREADFRTPPHGGVPVGRVRDTMETAKRLVFVIDDGLFVVIRVLPV